MMKKPANTERKQGGSSKFKKGVSGNPSGKKPGTRHRITLAMEELLNGEAGTLTRKAIELALEGDLTALRLCLDRICPPRKSRAINIQLPNTKTVIGISNAQAVVVQAVGDGTLIPEEGQILSNILEARRKSVETEELAQRIKTLEEIAEQR